ncbi:hypothetical protein AB0C15_13030 [Micromonospora sp. NPDC048835]|uniref:hypothetical protein n=1 Tax=Micromonospora sp. NPDC048835 TaxID=3155147 RepID=UPI00340DB3B5
MVRQSGGHLPPGMLSDSKLESEAVQAQFHLERYRYILQQIQAANENVHRFLSIYQTLATALIGAALAIFVGYSDWGVTAGTARAGILALMWLVTIIAAFTILVVIVGVLTWLDYRKEECQLLSEVLHPEFRSPPKIRNFYRWYETYIVAFIAVTIAAMWWCATKLIIPSIQL